MAAGLLAALPVCAQIPSAQNPPASQTNAATPTPGSTTPPATATDATKPSGPVSSSSVVVTMPILPPAIPPQPPFPNIPAAQLVWSTPLENDPAMPLRSDADAVRLSSAALVGDRAVALYEIRPLTSLGGRPQRSFRLISLEVSGGRIQGQHDLTGSGRPTLRGTDDAHLVLDQGSLSRLNPDLTESGEHYGDAVRGAGIRAMLLSPDGGTLAAAFNGTTQFLDAHTLKALPLRLQSPEPEAAGKRALLSTAAVWTNQFPRERSFIALYGGLSPRLLYHGACGGHPAFLDEQRILTVACGRVTIYDLAGNTLKELPVGAANGAFAGVSRDGSRFAIESSDYSVNDPSFTASELFTIYDAQSYLPVATVVPDALPEARSWAAFSQDGKGFLTGGPRRASFYRVP